MFFPVSPTWYSLHVPDPSSIHAPHRAKNAVPAPSGPLDGYFPGNDAVQARLAQLARRHPERVQVQSLGQTVQGRSIDQVLVTDPRHPALDKQHVLIAAGQHGNEESARLVALKLLDYLLSSEGRPTLARQVIAILPNVSPDAAGWR